MKPLLMVSLLALSGVLWSADEGRESPSVGTNVIGTQEAPTVLNVVPWKDKEVKLGKKDPTSSLLNRVLEPLDQDVLLREVEYYRILNQEEHGDDLFLE
ncbi:MAG: hypothetical protein KBT87_06560 [Gammaproteobacteria bacterium]|nr:hypothetical protein [Gammaproteobacteria bacterium]MBQ0774313.1 hypothetical protein [Gammaproteobacteria bacterium]